MNGIIIAIDGASRRPGTPECIAVGACVVRDIQTSKVITHGAVAEFQSSSQRGEILGLILALEQCLNQEYETCYILTDSEYVFNTVDKEWYRNWANKRWKTVDGGDVKNKDLWESVMGLMDALEDRDIVYYHIKGHVIPFGKATARNLTEKDPTLQLLYKEIVNKFIKEYDIRQQRLIDACELFERNNGIKMYPAAQVFRDMITTNILADTVAGLYADSVIKGNDSEE